MRALWVFHFPVYGGPHNTAVGVRGPLADLGWGDGRGAHGRAGNAEQRLIEGGLETVTMPLHRLRASWTHATTWRRPQPFAARCARWSS